MKKTEFRDSEKELSEDRKRVDALMKRAEEASKRFDDLVRDFRQHC